MTSTSASAESARRRRAPRLAGIGIACLLASVFAGCGSDNETTETVPPPETSQAPTGETPATGPAGLASDEPDAAPAETEGATEDGTENVTEEKPTGGFPMPPGEVPQNTSEEDDTAPKSGGIQMPETGDSPEPSASQSSSSTSGPGQSAAGGELDLQYAQWQSVHQTATEGDGRITVVDVWALSCQPCLKEFPGLVELHERFGDSARCIGFNVDFDGRESRPPESYEGRISEFLRAVEADFPNYVSQTPSLEVFDALGIDSIPAVLVFDQQGELVEQFADTGETAGFTYEDDIIPLVARLAG